MQSPSSLVFLVLLGVWAAVALQFWIRRRDHLATAHSVEQFSEAMRVLEARGPVARTDLGAPTARPSTFHAQPARSLAREEAPVAATPSGVPATASPHAAGPAPVRRTRVRPSRRVRALVFLASLLATLTLAVLVPLGLVAPWGLAAAGATLLASFAFVRSGVRAEQAMRAARRRRASQEALRRAAAPAAVPATRPVAPRPARTASPATIADETASAVGPTASEVSEKPAGELVAPVVVEAAAEPEVATEPVAPAAPAPAPVEVVAEVETVVEYVHLVDEDDIPLTWDPVPVPRPTYTMKAKAERAEVPPAEVTPDPAPRVEQEPAYEERRVAGA